MNKTIRKIFSVIKIWWLQLLYPKRIQIGEGCLIDLATHIKIHKKSTITIGRNVLLRSLKKGYHAGMPFPTCLYVDCENAHISIGDNTRINGAYIHAQKKIVIGSNCVIASGINILDSNGHSTKSLDRIADRDLPAEITIGDNVWLGVNVIILKGTYIGNNSVVGAGSVVKGNFPDNVVIQGNPAKVIKHIDYERAATSM